MQLLTSVTYFNSAAISIDLEIAFTVAIESTIALLIKAYGGALLSSVFRGGLSVTERLARIDRLRESFDQQVAPIDPALKPWPTHCLIKLGRVRPLIEGIALSRVTLVRSFWVTRKVKVI